MTVPPQPVAKVGDAVSVAVAGDRVLYSTVPYSTVRLRDDTGRVLGRVHLRPRGRTTAAVVASPQRVALSVYNDGAAGVFAGAPSGPLAPLTPLRDPATDAVAAYDVDGTRVFAAHVGPAFRWTAFEPGRPEAGLHIPSDVAPIDVAGDAVAYARGGRIVVADWRTNRIRHTFEGGSPFVLRADGSVAYVRGDELRVGVPDGSHRTLTADADLAGGQLVAAGARLAYADRRQVTLVEPDGKTHRLGPRTTEVGRLAASGDRVAWTANGCLLTARVDAGATDAIPKGPCRRTEVDRTGVRDDRLHRRVRLPCLAGPGGVCRVRVGTKRYRIRVGTKRWIRYRRFSQVLLVDPGGRGDPIR